MRRFLSQPVRSLVFCITLITGVSPAFAQKAKNLTKTFQRIYNQNSILSEKEITQLRNYQFILIPGILAETMDASDERTKLKLTLLVSGYYETQLELFNKKYKINAIKLRTSSNNINETRSNIHQAADDALKLGKKPIFISHSLGGLVLIDELATSRSLQQKVAGAILLQSPFQGTHLASFVHTPPTYLKKILHPLLPWVNVSKETLEYITQESRKAVMTANELEILSLSKNIPMFTFSSISKKQMGLLKPLIDLNKAGCIKEITDSFCVTPKVYPGPYDESDGLIPRGSSFIKHVDYIYTEDVDHIELVMPAYKEKYNKEKFLNTLLKMLLQKMEQQLL